MGGTKEVVLPRMNRHKVAATPANALLITRPRAAMTTTKPKDGGSSAADTPTRRQTTRNTEYARQPSAAIVNPIANGSTTSLASNPGFLYDQLSNEGIADIPALAHLWRRQFV